MPGCRCERRFARKGAQQESGNLFPDPPVSGAIGSARGAAAASPKSHAAQLNRQNAVIEGHGLALACGPERIGLWCQNALPLNFAFFTVLDAVHLAIVKQQKAGPAVEWTFEDALRRRIACGNRFLAQGGLARERIQVATRQAADRQQQGEASKKR